MKRRYCNVELIANKSGTYQVEFIGRYRPWHDQMGRMSGTKLMVATHICRYPELQKIIDQWIDDAKLPNES